MKKLILVIVFTLIVGLGFTQTITDYPIKSIPFTQVKITDSFWQKRLEINRKATIPSCFKKCEETGRIDNFAIAGKVKKGKFASSFSFDDSDVYKVIEGASYSLSIYPDPKLDKYLDSLINLISKAQEPDGYLYTNRTIDPANTLPMSGKERWVNESKSSHELYNAGHLYEAAVAHYLATGKRTLLNVALKNADLIDKTFGPDKRHVAPGHEVIEMGLVKLYRVTGEKKYLTLAKFFIDERGHSQRNRNSKNTWENGKYFQDYKPVVDQDEAEGHAVRATYLYSGMADIAALTGDSAYIKALDKIWNNVVNCKLYITGGIGSNSDDESFGSNYYLPNLAAYNETCAAISNIFWNQRMFMLQGDSKYIDVLERSLYNGMIAGVSMEGTEFFYPNPLECDGKYKFNQGTCSRKPWFDCSCCPSNVVRMIPSIPGYIYAQKDNVVYVNLYISSNTNIVVNKNVKTEIQQESNYPWDGDIKINVNPVKKSKFQMNLRIPCWAENKPLPGSLYTFADNDAGKVIIRINGKDTEFKTVKGYAVIDREWKKGDIVELLLPMDIRRVRANEKVEADKNRITIERGPIVYCAEGIDNSGKVSNLIMSDDVKLTASYNKDLLNGVELIKGEVPAIKTLSDGKSVKTEQQAFTAIPYYSWAHRGVYEMRVWLPEKINYVTIPSQE